MIRRPQRSARFPYTTLFRSILSGPVLPSSVWRHLPEAVSQTLTVRSYDADASRLSSCEKATDMTEPLWPSSVWRHLLEASCLAVLVITYSASACFLSSCEKPTDVLHPRAASYVWRR